MINHTSRITHHGSRITPEGNIYPKNQIICNIIKAHVFSLVGNWMRGFAYHIAVEHFSDNNFTMLKVKKVKKF
jgi:hypothetical protein